MIQVDIGDLLFTLGRYIHRLARDDFALRIKARFCSLCEASLAKQDYVLLSNNARLRNALLDWSYEWSAESLRVREIPAYLVS